MHLKWSECGGRLGALVFAPRDGLFVLGWEDSPGQKWVDCNSQWASNFGTTLSFDLRRYGLLVALVCYVLLSHPFRHAAAAIPNAPASVIFQAFGAQNLKAS